MSSKLHGLVWEACAFKGLIISEIAVMARLADFSNDEGVSWPAVTTIQRQIGAKSENTVRSAIKKLQAKHPCEKPADMLQQIITASSRPGDVVADFFAGSGSTLKQAALLGRSGIGVELETERFEQTVSEMRNLLV